MRLSLIALTFVISTHLWAQPHEEALSAYKRMVEIEDSMMVAYESDDWENALKSFEKLNVDGKASCKDYYIASNCYDALSKSATNASSIGDLRSLSLSLYEKGVEYCGVDLMSEIMTASVYSVVEDMPGPKMGIEAYYKDYLEISYRYSERDSLYGAQGIVYVSIMLNKDGSIGGCRVLRGVTEDLDREAIRMIHEGPEWNPGVQRGKAVYMNYTIAIVFNYKQNYKLRKKENKENRKRNRSNEALNAK